MLLLTISIAISQDLLAMDQHEEIKTPQVRSDQSSRSDSIRPEKTKKRNSLTVNFLVTDQQAIPKHVSDEASHTHRVSTSSDRASVIIQTPESARQEKGKNFGQRDRNSVIIEIEMSDIKNATAAEIDQLVDDLIRQAGIATFDAHDEHAFYVRDLKTTLLQAFNEFIKKDLGHEGSSSSESESDSSSEKRQHDATHHEDQTSGNADESVDVLRTHLFRSFSSRHLKNRAAHESRHPAAASSSQATTTSEHKELKKWFLRELELHDLKMREQESQMKEKVAASEKKLTEENRKKKYAILATLVTTACGIGTAVTTYFITHTLSQASS